MSATALAIEDALVAALSLPSLVAGRVARGDAFALPDGVEDGVLVRLIGLPSLDASLSDDCAMARWAVEVELQKLGASGQSAVQGLSGLVVAVHARFMADRSLGGLVQRICLPESDPLDFQTTAGGQSPAHSAILRYEIHSNLNSLTLGA